jgi:hypothetical protein
MNRRVSRAELCLEDGSGCLTIGGPLHYNDASVHVREEHVPVFCRSRVIVKRINSQGQRTARCPSGRADTVSTTSPTSGEGSGAGSVG